MSLLALLISLSRWLCILSLSFVLGGCSQNFQGGEGVQEEKPSPSAATAAAGGIAWESPSRWKLGPRRPMRAATYKIPANPGDAEDAECAVFYFGPGQGGGIQANLRRWYGQFEQPNGRPSSEVAATNERTRNGLKITTVSLSGTYLFSPAPMSPQKERKPNFHLLAAIVEAPQGPVFFKLTGPSKTVLNAEREFNALLDSLRKQ